MDSETLVQLNVARHSGQKLGTSEMLKMISDQTAPQPTARESLYHLLAMIADPKAVKQRLDQLDAAAAAAEKKIAAAAEAEKATAKLEDELKAARKRNEEAMADDRAAQQVELTRRHDELPCANARLSSASKRSAAYTRRPVCSAMSGWRKRGS